MSEQTALSSEQLTKMSALAQSVQAKLTAQGRFEIGRVNVRGNSILGFLNQEKNLREFYEKFSKQYQEFTFLVYENERLTFGEVHRQATCLANYLSSKLGVTKGKRVAMFMRNWPEWCICFHAITMMGAVCVPLNGWWLEEEVEYGLQNSGSCVVVCDKDRYKRCAPCLSKLNITAILIREGPFVDNKQNKTVLWSDIITSSFSAPTTHTNEKDQKHDVEILPEDNAAIMYTSGTTGHPKGVVLSHRSILSQMSMSLFGAEMMKQVMKIAAPNAPADTTQPCSICPIPLFHVTACHHLYLASYTIGRKLVIMSRWDAGLALALVEKEKATAWTGVPTMIQDMMEHPDFAKRDLSSMKIVGAGGAPTPKAQVFRVNKAFKMVGRPQQGYGLTETNGAICTINGDAYVLKPTSTGAPFPIVEVKCVDLDTGKDCKQGERGELLIRSTLVMTGYWNNQKATEEVLTKEAWFRTGDVAILDKENYIYIVDRAKQIIIRGGENISCAEVEAALMQNTAVMEACVFGLPDERLGEKVAAMILLKPESKLTAQALHASVKEVLAAFKVPLAADIYFSSSALPRGATGKTQKRDVRDSVLKQINSKAKL